MVGVELAVTQPALPDAAAGAWFADDAAVSALEYRVTGTQPQRAADARHRAYRRQRGRGQRRPGLGDELAGRVRQDLLSVYDDRDVPVGGSDAAVGVTA